jgi:hypothetical protein
MSSMHMERGRMEGGGWTGEGMKRQIRGPQRIAPSMRRLWLKGSHGTRMGLACGRWEGEVQQHRDSGGGGWGGVHALGGGSQR